MNLHQDPYGAGQLGVHFAVPAYHPLSYKAFAVLAFNHLLCLYQCYCCTSNFPLNCIHALRALTLSDGYCSFCLYRPYWQGAWRLMSVPPATFNGQLATLPCLAIVPPPSSSQESASSAHQGLHSPEALIVRCTDTQALSELRVAMARSRTTMQAVAGLLNTEVSAPEEAGGGISAAEATGQEVGELSMSEISVFVSATSSVSLCIFCVMPSSVWCVFISVSV